MGCIERMVLIWVLIDCFRIPSYARLFTHIQSGSQSIMVQSRKVSMPRWTLVATRTLGHAVTDVFTNKLQMTTLFLIQETHFDTASMILHRYGAHMSRILAVS